MIKNKTKGEGINTQECTPKHFSKKMFTKGKKIGMVFFLGMLLLSFVSAETNASIMYAENSSGAMVPLQVNDYGRLKINLDFMNLTAGDLSATGNISLGQKITFAFGEVIDNIQDGWVRVTGDLNVTGGSIDFGGKLLSNDGGVLTWGGQEFVSNVSVMYAENSSGSAAPLVVSDNGGLKLEVGGVASNIWTVVGSVVQMVTAGNVNISGNLDVYGDVNTTGNLEVGGDVNVTGNLKVIGNLSGGIQYAYLKDVKASGQSGGACIVGVYANRSLNSSDSNIGGFGLDSITGEFTLPAGTYTLDAMAPGYRVDQHKIRLWNVNDSSVPLVGSTSYSDSDAAPNRGYMNSFLVGQFNITSTKTFSIQHRCATQDSASDFGTANSFGDSEIYTQVKLIKII